MVFPFLKLPPEIRNFIYNMVAAADGEHVTLTNPKNDDKFHERSWRLKQPRSVSTFAALTRVCRDIRWEYLPLQRKIVSVSVYYGDTNDYMNTFFDPDKPGRTFKIIISSHEHRDVSQWTDVFPLLRAHARFPGEHMSKFLHPQSTTASAASAEPFSLCSGRQIEIGGMHGLTLDGYTSAHFCSLLRLTFPNSANWVTRLRESPCMFKAVYFNMGAQKVNIVLKRGFIDLDLESEDAVEGFLTNIGLLNYLIPSRRRAWKDFFSCAWEGTPGIV